jgi:hypothetical protein
MRRIAWHEGQPVAIADILRGRNLPEWRKEALQEADQVEAGYGSRYIGVPQADSHEAYRDMQVFISTVQDERLEDRLWRAISGRGAFRYFKDVLTDYPRERERWFEFKDAQVRQRVLDWLESEGIEPIDVIRGMLTVRRAWKGFRFEVLDALEEQGYLNQSRRAKSVTLTEKGVERAQALQARYLGR